MDFTKLCRLCLSTKELKPIFNSESEDMLYLNNIYIATGIKIEKNDGLPQVICSDCSRILQNTLEFRMKCKNTEIKLIAIKEENVNKVEINDAKPIKSNLEKDHTNNENIFIQNISANIDIGYDGDKNIESSDEDEKPLILLTQNSIKNSENPSKITKDMLFDINDDTSRITCKLCQKVLSPRSLSMHMVRHHPGTDDSRVRCELCDDYVLRDNLKRHLTSLHGTDSFKCRYCKKEFNNKDLLVDHVASCAVKKKRRESKASREVIECDVCHKKMQRASLRTHTAIKHAGLRPVCEHCGKSFGNKFRLGEHCRAKHGYEKFKCKYCDFQSAGVMAMRNHERRHRGEKPFVCEACGAGFHAAYLLAQHRQSHRTDKRFKCPQCPAAFKANNSLHMHVRACHGRARVRCALCARAYSCRHYAVKHMRAVHRYCGPVPPLALSAGQ